jgi:hypothetical protein
VLAQELEICEEVVGRVGGQVSGGVTGVLRPAPRWSNSTIR